MLKNVIAPIQAWLLSQGRCVADGQPLDKVERKEGKNGNFIITHSCGRIYIFDAKSKKYRRALLNEV